MQHQSPPSIKCPICKCQLRVITDPESQENICEKCGMVLSDKVHDIMKNQAEMYDIFAVSRIFDRRQRSWIPTSLARYDMGLSTVIGKENRDASGKRIDAAMHVAMQRLRTWDSRAQIRTSSSDRSLIQAFHELDMLKDKLALPDALVEKAAYTYRKAKTSGLTRGRTISGLVAACVYATCREMNTPRTLKDIAAAASISHKHLAKIYRVLVIELDIKVPLVDQIKCIAKVANKANLTEKTKRQAIRTMDEVIQISAGKNPMGFAATILYISCLKTGESKTQTDIAYAAGVTEVTIRNRYKELKSKLQLSKLSN
ncbi:MAG TPA: transcription initiation factor IIB [Nitrososphaeraceae archaeon]|nr:transcription initiation factor IIB [Nitrososphaeraceae archaeon]